MLPIRADGQPKLLGSTGRKETGEEDVGFASVRRMEVGHRLRITALWWIYPLAAIMLPEMRCSCSSRSLIDTNPPCFNSYCSAKQHPEHMIDGVVVSEASCDANKVGSCQLLVSHFWDLVQVFTNRQREDTRWLQETSLLLDRFCSMEAKGSARL